MDQLPESISVEQLQTLIGKATHIGAQPVNNSTYKQQVEEMLETLEELERKMGSLLPSGVLPQRWECFVKAKRQIKLARRLLRKSIST